VPYKLIKNHNIGGTSKILGWVVADHEVISLQNQLPDDVAVILGKTKSEKALTLFKSCHGI